MRAALRLTLLVCGLVAWVALVEPPPKPPRTHLGPLLPRRELLDVVFAGHKTLLADVFWMRTLQQVGLARTAQEYGDIYPWADLTTDIDPDFQIVYRFAAVAMTYNLGRDRWVNTVESTQLLRKGTARFPTDWWMKFLLGFNLLFYERDYVAGARVMAELKGKPGVPPHLERLATRALAQGGQFDAAEEMARALMEGAQDPAERAYYEHRLLQIYQERVLVFVDGAVRAFRAANDGRRPKDIDELLAAGFLRGVPVDPLGGTIFIDEDGRGRATSEWYRLELFENAKREAATRAQGSKADFDPGRQPGDPTPRGLYTPEEPGR